MQEDYASDRRKVHVQSVDALIMPFAYCVDMRQSSPTKCSVLEMLHGLQQHRFPERGVNEHQKAGTALFD